VQVVSYYKRTVPISALPYRPYINMG